MMDYSAFRQFADSWGLLYLFLLFVGVIAFTFRPGSKKTAEEIAQIPLKEDNDDV
ncbi:MAG: CcoQ/FixQ family Cbb3-type cytochrome c oxidase assembly chaperone [Rhizobiaceae bacterium]|nr:CcoQ/FixQ family Cbb3-type cytochrome c oxidase assembly chaperone [Rhizobiaceae bacterium]